MRILMIHNYYQCRGGEDESAEQELQLLKAYGHEVQFYSRHNNEIKSFCPLRKGLLFFETSWSLKSYREIKEIIRKFNPDIAHFHNIFPLISPSAYYACMESGVPVVQTLRDWRLLCPLGWFFRNGAICEECFKRSLFRGILHGCYHESHIQTIPIVLMLKVHRLLNTWQKKVDAFITLTDFSSRKFIEGGLPATKIFTRPNFLAKDPGIGESARNYALFVGRLSMEKGVITLLKAWKELPEIPLKIVGEGPLRPRLERYIREHALTQVELIGYVPLDVVFECLKKSLFIVMPSTSQETFGRIIIEAYATGTPVIASRIGAIIDLVEEGKTGLLFKPCDPDDLLAKVQYTLEHPTEVANWRQEARYTFEQKFSSEVAYKRLMEIYRWGMRMK